MNFRPPHIDLLSFGLGFALATIFWLILLRLSHLLPRIRKAAEEERVHKQQSHDLGREHNLRVYMLRQAESTHLASSLFPLEKIQVEPKVITPARFLPATEEELHPNALYTVLPEFAEIPELLSGFPVLKNSLLTLLQAGQRYIAVAGSAGSGKTTALAALVSKLCSEQNPASTRRYLPIFFDYNQLETGEQPFWETLIEFLAQNVKGLSTSILNEILNHAAENERLVLVIDGLDLLPLPQLGKGIQHIADLQKSFPKAAILTTCDLYQCGDLESLGFDLFPLAPWTKEEKHLLLQKWKAAWMEIPSSDKERTERILLWQLQEELPDSPYELTLKAWAAFAGTSTSNSAADPAQLVEGYLQTITGNWLTLQGAEALAATAELSPFPQLTRERALAVLSTTPEALISSSAPTPVVSSSSSRKKAENLTIPAPEEVLDWLVKGRFFDVTNDDHLLFHTPQSYVALKTAQEGVTALPKLETLLQNPIQRLMFYQKRVISQENYYEVDTSLAQADAPLYRDTLFALQLLRQTVPGDPLREKLFRSTARLLQQINLPLGLRGRFLLALVQTHDPSIGSLFKYFSLSPDASMRQLSALGLGLLAEEKHVPVLIKLSQDRDTKVAAIACLSLSKIWTPTAQDGLVNIILSASEPLRILACELLTLHPAEREQTLSELASTENVLARKAAISGLLHLSLPWVTPLFEKLSIEDPQWVVRDAAKFALEHPLSLTTFAPAKCLPIYENPWTLKKAEEHQLILPERSLPEELLYEILEKDSPADRLLALHYLLTEPTSRLVQQLEKFIADSDSELREPALNALFSLAKQGFDLQVH